ncbi:hypothetical protein EJ05DRAFT_496138 [Pseudovirgaria hyperparasitica]|uniref:DUF4336 domain-containing protein n=1 Tax=Pseudovirgaria hyperparasitica TaxID=470096 RepID=A0A6A6WM78_9PEZI|nr:uncharacterized protein EJ05DRAFT_496138 [Pseudovirgaria hyperparasitica]KAF2763311.1 hypothetical protein EJ05DRAFT_496138 [Pseudovirgaria hyperparasitica]
MTDKLIPSDPSRVMVIRDVIPNVITTLSTPFLRFGKIKIGGRGTLVRLQSGSLAVFSPTALTPEVKEKVSSLGGRVKYIVAPDLEHHIFLGPWAQFYPGAKVIGMEGLREKRAKQENEDIPFAVTFTSKDKDSVKIDTEFDAEFDYEYVPAHANKELVFNHKPSKTLIEADLIFNMPATEQMSRTSESATTGILTKIWTYLTNTNGTALAQKRLIWYGISAGDRTGYAKSMAKINGWDFDRIIPCHGDVIETGGKGIFQKVMQWHLKLAEKH